MKRFTATEKWKDPWFRQLPLAYKTFWLYLCDECDNGGFIDPDKDLASFIIGAPLDLQEALRLFNGRVEVLQSGKWHLTKFVQFQYGELNAVNPCHRGVLRIIKERTSEGPSKDLQRTLQGPQEKEKEKNKEEEKETEEGEVQKGEVDLPLISEVKRDIKAEAIKVLDYLNEKAGRTFRKVDSNLKPIQCRLVEPDVTLEGVFQMIDRQVAKWGTDPKMSEYLRPETLFAASKFASYYDQRDLPVPGAKQIPIPGAPF